MILKFKLFIIIFYRLIVIHNNPTFLALPSLELLPKHTLTFNLRCPLIRPPSKTETRPLLSSSPIAHLNPTFQTYNTLHSSCIVPSTSRISNQNATSYSLPSIPNLSFHQPQDHFKTPTLRGPLPHFTFHKLPV